MYSVLVFARVLLGHTFETNLTTSSEGAGVSVRFDAQEQTHRRGCRFGDWHDGDEALGGCEVV